jgi:pyruvate dehydrogenase E2 component (dihydrolipoamide acetyltransferase)
MPYLPPSPPQLTLRRRAPAAPPRLPAPGPAADALAAALGFPPPQPPPPAPQAPSPIAGLPNSLAGAEGDGPLARLQLVLHRVDLTPETAKWVDGFVRAAGCALAAGLAPPFRRLPALPPLCWSRCPLLT